jgi:nucleoside phosphorylase
MVPSKRLLLIRMAILYVAADAAELKPFANRLTGLRALRWPVSYAQEGILDGRRILLAANGAGPALAERAVEVAIRAVTAADLMSSKLEAVVSVGFCGALTHDLQEGQIVVASEVVSATEVFEAVPVETSFPCVSDRIFSQDRIASTADEKSELAARFNSIAVEMEAAGVARRAKRTRLPFACIKAVLDRADESFGLDFNASRSPEGRISRGKIMFQAVAKPGVLPELFRLRRRTELAARALGDFLVSCRFAISSVSTPDLA